MNRTAFVRSFDEAESSNSIFCCLREIPDRRLKVRRFGKRGACAISGSLKTSVLNRSSKLNKSFCSNPMRIQFGKMPHFPVDIRQRAVEICDGVRFFQIRTGNALKDCSLIIPLIRRRIKTVFRRICRNTNSTAIYESGFFRAILYAGISGKLSAECFQNIPVEAENFVEF